MPALVIISGPPATGKSILAEALSRALSMPVISKDLIKESLMDDLGGAPAVGAASFSLQFAIARELLESGVAIILEGAFFREQQEIAELAQLAKPVVVSVTCQLDVLEQRYLERHPQRHPGHRGPEALPDLRRRVAKDEYGIPDIQAPVLKVDTTMTPILRSRRSSGGSAGNSKPLPLTSAPNPTISTCGQRGRNILGPGPNGRASQITTATGDSDGSPSSNCYHRPDD